MANRSTYNLDHQSSAPAQGNPLSIPSTTRSGEGASLAHERWITQKLLALAGHPPVTLELWDGQRITSEQATPRYTLRLKDRRALYELAMNPNLSFGDLYSAGRLEVEGSLVEVMEDIYWAIMAASENMPLWLRALWRNHAPRPTSLDAARENIHHHYDLGNDFYSLWLDRAEMQYTCAYYESADMNLEAAQLAKLEHVCRKLQLKPGQTVVEAGCGWGGLARYMAREYGVRVRAFNISQEQVSHAREEARRQGLDDRIEYVLDDYRNMEGKYDAFVSVGMLEHVGTRHYETLAGIIRRVLHKDGLALIHTIGRNRPDRINAWIEKRIFPGAHPPSIAELTGLAEAGPFSVLDVENLRLHYAQTLTHWMERFEENAERVEQMYDPHFVRAWRLYLAGSIAAFTTSSLQLFQMVMAHPHNNTVPRNRRHLYEKPVTEAGGLA